MADRKSLEELENLSPQELGDILLYELRKLGELPKVRKNMNDASDIAYIKSLIDAGAPLDIKDDKLITPLHRVVKLNNYKLTTLFIEAGVDINARDIDGWTPLFHAVHRGNFNITDLLVKSGADLNIRNNSGESVLFISRVRSPFTKLLLAAGASNAIRSNSGQYAWDITPDHIRRDVPELNPNYND